MKKLSVVTSLAVAAAILSMVGGESAQSKVKAGDVTGGAVAPHVNIAAFHKLHGQEGFRFPDHIDDADIMAALSGKAQYIFLNHTAGLKDGDVITISSDVLRENAGQFEDFGVDCQMSVHLEGERVSLGGMCEVLFVDRDHREIEHKLMIKPVSIQPGKSWVLLYNDDEDGIAIYADEEVGIE